MRQNPPFVVATAGSRRFRLRSWVLVLVVFCLAADGDCRDCLDTSDDPDELDIIEAIDDLRATGRQCIADGRSFDEVLREGRERIFAGASYEDLVPIARDAHTAREASCAARDEREDDIDRRLPALLEDETSPFASYAAGYLLRTRLALSLEVSEDSSAFSSDVPDLDIFNDSTLPDYFACVTSQDSECSKEQLHRVGMHLATLSARDAYLVGEAFPAAVDRIAHVLSDEQRERFLRAAGPVALLVCDNAKYLNTNGNCLAFLQRHRDLLATGSASESPLTEEACLFDVGSGSLRCFSTNGEEACLAPGTMLESFSGANGAVGRGSCAYLQMASFCVPGVGPTCPADACNPDYGVASDDPLSPGFRTVSGTTMSSDGQAAVADSCAEGFDSHGGPGGESGGAFGAAQALPGNYCHQKLFASLFHRESLVRRCIGAHQERLAERMQTIMNPLSALSRDDECAGNPYTDGGTSDSDEDDDGWSRWLPNGDLCLLDNDCINSDNLQDYFGSDEWESFKQEYTSLYQAATGDTISDEDWAAAEEEAARVRKTTSKCRKDAIACTKNPPGNQSKDGIRVYYNEGYLTKTEKEAKETGGHEAAHVAGARASWDDRTKDEESMAYYRALDHLTMCKAGDTKACQQYEDEKSKLPQEQQDDLDEAEDRIDEQVEASESDGTTMPACNPMEGSCIDACSPSALAAQKAFRDCSLMSKPDNAVSPLDPYVQPGPDGFGGTGDDFNLGACISATEQARREEADACAEFTCASGESPEPCASGQGCCCGGVMEGAMLPVGADCAEVVMCRNPTEGNLYAGGPRGTGMCGCESTDGVPHPTLPGKDPGRVFLGELESGDWAHPEGVQ